MMDSSMFHVSYSVRKARAPPQLTADSAVIAEDFCVGVRERGCCRAGSWRCKEAMAEPRGREELWILWQFTCTLD